MSNSFLVVIALLTWVKSISQTNNTISFKVIPLGVKGGLDESNLSAYLIAPAGTNNYICVDAGTIRAGIDKAISSKVFKADAATVLKKYVKGYLISHGHLDHISGLIINSPDDTAKRIYAMPYVTEVLKNKYFTWESWANFANEGDKPTLNKYEYTTLSENKETQLANTGMHVKAFSLSHSNPYESTAFLLNNNRSYLLYFGDTGPDEIEKSGKLDKVWRYITPLIQNHTLKGIFIEVSFPDEQPNTQLFGHLTPKWLMKEMTALSKLTGKEALKNFPVIITHIKPSGTNKARIYKQLKQQNTSGLKIIYPKQGRMLLL